MRRHRHETPVLREIVAALALSGCDVINLDCVQTAAAAALLIRRATERQASRSQPGAVIWRVNTGGAYLPGRGGSQTFVRMGLPGQADLQGIIQPWGIALQIEVKTDRPGSKQSEAQLAVEQLVVRLGGVYFVARSGTEARERFQVALAELAARAASQATMTGGAR